VPLGIAVALLLLTYGRAVWGLMLVALPLVVPWNMIPMLWLGLIQPETGLLGPGLAAIGFDWKFTGWHTWVLILVVDTWHWLGLVVVWPMPGCRPSPRPTGRRRRLTGRLAGRSFGISSAKAGRGAGDRVPAALCRQFHDLHRGLRDQRRRPGDATRFLSLELGEEIKGFSYGQAAARATLYFLIVLAVVWAFVVATRRRNDPA
jgi:glycerol transport system permease protein